MDPIQHVIVVMFENRSFDHMLGTQGGVNGVDPAHPRSNRESLAPNAPVYSQAPVAHRLDLDPAHDLHNVLTHLDTDGPNGGFVIDFATTHKTSTQEERQEVMNYFPHGDLPAMHALADAFTVCDTWHSSVPGPTWTNRLFALSGTSKGRVKMPDGFFHPHLHFYNQDTIFDRLNEAGKSWRIYHGGFPLSLILLHQQSPTHAVHYHGLSKFFKACAGSAATFPSFTFIEPAYHGRGQNDQHPATDVNAGDALLGRIYNAVRANEPLWQSTLLVCLHDEHGGFYDHVSPPLAVPPDDHHEEYTFDRLGVRVPALLISPWVKAGVLTTRFDHTSLLRYLIDKWQLGPLGARTAAASSFAGAIEEHMRNDTPQSVPVVAAAEFAAPAVADELNDLQKSYVAFSQALDVKTVEPPARKVARYAMTLQGPAAQIEVAIERVENFLAQQRRKAVALTALGVTRELAKGAAKAGAKRLAKKAGKATAARTARRVVKRAPRRRR